MKIDSDDFRVREGKNVDLKKWPTDVKPYYKSDDDPAMSAAFDFHAGEVLATLPYPRPEQFADAIDQLSQANPRILEVDLSKLLDPSFVQDAADRGVGGTQ